MYKYDVCFALIYNEKLNRYTANILTAAIENKIDFAQVYLMPLLSDNPNLQELLPLNHKCRKIAVGITFMTTQVELVLSLVPKIRALIPKALLIAGGPHATGDPYGTLTKLGLDIVVYGEGEASLIDLLKALYNDKDINVCGTTYIDQDGSIIVKKRAPIDLNLYPPFPYWRNRFNPIEIMRGCSSACHFCQVTYVYGIPRYRDIDNIVYYARLKFEKGLKDLRFIAPNSFGYGSANGVKPNTDQLLSLLFKLRFLADHFGGRVFFGTFPSEVRPDSVEEDLVKEVRRLVNNKRIIIGGQSGSDNILKKINRKHTAEDIEYATEILIKNGFEVDVDLILGFGFETEEDIEKTKQLIDKLIKLKARIHLHTFIPLPGTPLFSIGFKPLNNNVKKYLTKLIGGGIAYGYWSEQERIAYKIEALKRREIIYDLYSYYKKLKIVKC
ncbi:MAG: TIGR04013 family B12-binding domain/radical SAM domain-containing protein [Ignisphaera sp.]|uniref:TIGR04013 family B12-binding domain/radical SAM domain-containing protein n=1 Tax=Ignisphaera aggregans TaxID=334771 RepID=A0A7C4JJL8_9CREN